MFVISRSPVSPVRLRRVAFGSGLRGGKAQDGVRVGFVPADPTQGGGSKGATTNADGKFELKVPPGKYVVEATGPNGEKVKKPVALSGQTERKLRLELE